MMKMKLQNLHKNSYHTRVILGWNKYFDRGGGVPLYVDIRLIINFIPDESPSKMGFIGTKK